MKLQVEGLRDEFLCLLGIIYRYKKDR